MSGKSYKTYVFVRVPQSNGTSHVWYSPAELGSRLCGLNAEKFIQLQHFFVNNDTAIWSHPEDLHFVLTQARLPEDGGFASEQAPAWVLMPLGN